MAIWKKEPSPKVGIIAMLEGGALVVVVSCLGERETLLLADGPRDDARLVCVFVCVAERSYASKSSGLKGLL